MVHDYLILKLGYALGPVAEVLCGANIIMFGILWLLTVAMLFAWVVETIAKRAGLTPPP